MIRYSSLQAAKKLGISDAVLSKYILTGKIPAPESVRSGGITVYLWTDEDIERVRDLLPKIKNGRKTRYLKKQPAGQKSKTKKKPQPRAAALQENPNSLRALTRGQNKKPTGSARC